MVQEATLRKLETTRCSLVLNFNTSQFRLDCCLLRFDFYLEFVRLLALWPTATISEIEVHLGRTDPKILDAQWLFLALGHPLTNSSVFDLLRGKLMGIFYQINALFPGLVPWATYLPT